MALRLQFVGCGDALTHMSDDMLNHADLTAYEAAEDGLILEIP